MVESAEFTSIVGRARGADPDFWRARSPDPVRIGPFSDHWFPERGRGSGGASEVNFPPGGPRRQRGGAVRVKDRVRGGERGLAQGDLLSDVSFSLLTGLEPLKIAANAYSMRLGLFPGGVNPQDVT